MHQQLISVEELARQRDSDPSLRVLDIRRRLGGPDYRIEYRGGHMPGAVLVDLEGRPASYGEPTDGRGGRITPASLSRPPRNIRDPD